MKYKLYFLIVCGIIANSVSIYTQELRGVIDQQLQSLGLPYVAENVVAVNQALGLIGGQVTECEIEDPYGTLNDCILFVAFDQIAYLPNSRRDSTPCIVGVSKGGSIKWYAHIYFDGITISEIYSTRDLNVDGTVDIVVECAFEMDRLSKLYIFSWDGNVGTQINALDEYGSSVIEGYFHSYDLSDVDGDGIIEIRSLPRRVEDSMNIGTWSWNGQYYGEWANTPIVPFTSWLPAKSAFAEVKCKIVKEDTIYRYEYSVKNNIQSKRRIQRFNVKSSAEALSKRYGSWFALGADDRFPLLAWRMIGLDYKNMIRPGEQKSGFTATSKGLPGINTFYIQSERGYMDIDYDLNGLRDDIINNSTSGITIAPANPPSPFNSIHFLDTLKSYTTQSLSLGWIANQTTANKYLAFFDTAKTQLQRDSSGKLSRSTLITVLQNANQDSSGLLTSEAYALIRFNTEYLIDNLPVPPPQYTLTVNIVGNGTVTRNPDLALYDSSTTVRLTATPSTGCNFTGWSGDVNDTANSVNIVMSSNKNVTATFTINTYTLTIQPNPNGVVTKNPDQPLYNHGTEIELTAVPNTCYEFTDWGGDLNQYTDNPITLEMNSNKNISVSYKLTCYILNITIVGSGTVVKTPNLATYPIGSSVTLKAKASKGYRFVGWSGDASGTKTKITVSMNGNKNITATFVRKK